MHVKTHVCANMYTYTHTRNSLWTNSIGDEGAVPIINVLKVNRTLKDLE